jgi:hypothetical protein
MRREHDNNTVPGRRPSLHVACGSNLVRRHHRRRPWPSSRARATTLQPAYHLSHEGRHNIVRRISPKGPPRVPLKVAPAAGNVVTSFEVEARLRLALLSNQTDSPGFLYRRWHRRCGDPNTMPLQYCR